MKRTICALLCVCLLLLPWLSGCGARDTKLTVLVLQAGKADAILFFTKNGAVLLDTGARGFGDTILAELEARGVERLDCLILSHFDKDHIGGAAKLLRSLPVERVLQSDRPRDSEEYARYLEALESRGVEAETLQSDLSFSLDGVEFSLNAPEREHYDKDESNNSSLILTVRCGENRLLFPGDAGNERIREWLARGERDFALLKLPHHGIWQKTLPALLAQTAPQYAVVTCSDKEPESEKTAALLEASGAALFFTRCGAICIVCSERDLRVSYIY